jgi:hypothetical protein
MREIIMSAARAGRRNTGRTILVAICVSSVTSVLETADHSFVDRTNVPVTVISDLGASGVSFLGVVIISGFLSQQVGEAGHGREHAGIGEVLRHLPWRRLILADLLAGLLIAAGTIALVIPGLLVTNLLVVVGPVVEIEDRPVVAALRRSAHLVRQHFWAVALLATLPVSLADELPSAVPKSASVKTLLMALLIRGVLGALIEAALGAPAGRALLPPHRTRPSAPRRTQPGRGYKPRASRRSMT